MYTSLLSRFDDHDLDSSQILVRNLSVHVISRDHNKWSHDETTHSIIGSQPAEVIALLLIIDVEKARAQSAYK